MPFVVPPPVPLNSHATRLIALLALADDFADRAAAGQRWALRTAQGAAWARYAAWPLDHDPWRPSALSALRKAEDTLARLGRWRAAAQHPWAVAIRARTP